MIKPKYELVNAIQEYVKDHLHEPVTLAMISSSVHYSLFYCSKVFKEIIGITIFEYIRKTRITEAAKVLRDNPKKIIDVAFDFVFDSHEGFTRAFAREFDITPKAYQKSPIPLPYFVSYPVTDISEREDRLSMETKACFIQVVERPKRKAIIKRGIKATHYFEYCDEVDCDIWGILTSVKEAISEPVGMWLSKHLQKPGTSMYVQGVEVPEDYEGVIPDGCELIDLPETLMMIFQGEPYDDKNFEEEVGQVMKYVKKYNPKVYGYEYDETGYRFQYEPQGYRGYIEGRTVKKI